MMKKHLLLAFFILESISAHAQGDAGVETYQSPIYRKIEHILVSPDKETIIGTDSSGYVLYWGKDGSIRKILRSHTTSVYHIALSKDGSKIATCSKDGQIIVWDFGAGQKINSAQTEGDVTSLAFNNEGDKIYFGTQQGLFQASSLTIADAERLYNGPVIHVNSDGYFLTQRPSGFSVLSLSGVVTNDITICRNIGDVLLANSRIYVLCADGELITLEANGASYRQVESIETGIKGKAHFIETENGAVIVAGQSKIMRWNPGSKIFLSGNTPESSSAIGYGNGMFYAGNGKGKITSFVPAFSEIFKDEVEQRTVPAKIEASAGGIPSALNGRRIFAERATVSSSSLELFIWDDEREDGDTISLYLNGRWLLQNYMITAEKKKLTVNLENGKTNYLILYAHNLGKLPPNTAVISFHDGKSERRLTVESDLKRCGAVQFILPK